MQHGHCNKKIGGQFVPVIDASSRRRIATADLRQRPKPKQIESSIQSINHSRQYDHS
jgi:hypothetical protein